MKSSLVLGVNPNLKRQEQDFYATHPNALKIFLKEFKELDKSNPIWECACGKGHLSEELNLQGFNVKSSDLIDRGYGEVQDFLSYEGYWRGNILTNPPFKLAEEFVEKSMEIMENGAYLCLFLKIQFLEGNRRYELFKKFPPKYVFVNSSRQLCSRDADFENKNATTLCFAWFVWEKGYSGETIIKWIKELKEKLYD